MNQDQRLYSTPHYLPHVKANSGRASTHLNTPTTTRPAPSFFEALYQQQIERAVGVLAKAVRCEECRDTGWLTVRCPENGTDIIPCDFCGKEDK